MKLLFFSLSFLFVSMLHAQDWKVLSQQIDTMIYKGQYKKALPFTEQTVLKIKSVLGENNDAYIKNLAKLGELYTIMDDYNKADSVLKNALMLTKATSGNDSAAYMEIFLKLGILYKRKANYASAENYFSQSLSIAGKFFGSGKPEYAKILSELGNMYDEKGALVKAETCLEEALKLQEKEIGIKHPDYAQTLNYLGWHYYNLSKNDKADSLHKFTLGIRKEIFGDGHPHYAQSLNAVASILTEKKEYLKAEKLYEQARIIRKEAYGEEHSLYANIVNNLGRIYLILREYEKAEKYYMEVLLIRKKVLGNSHPGYADILQSLGILYDNMKEYSKAEKYYLEELSVRRRVLGENHPDYASTLNSLGIFYENMKEYSKAETYYLETLSVRKRILGENHPHYANVLYNLGILYKNMEEYIKAEKYYLEALSVRKRVLGENHPHYADILQSLGILYSNIKEFSKAETYYLEALSVRKRVLGENHPHYANVLYNLGILYSNLKEYSKAEKYYLEALSVRKKILGENHPLYADILQSLGILYHNMKEYKSAEKYYLEALSVRKKNLGEDHTDYTSCKKSLGSLYVYMYKYDEAEKTLLEVKETYKKIYGIYCQEYIKINKALSNLYGNQIEFRKYETITIENLEIIRRLNGENSLEYALCLLDIIWANQGLNQYERAFSNYEKAFNIFEKVKKDKKDFDYQKLISTGSKVYYRLGDGKRAEEFATESVALAKTLYGDTSESYASSVRDLAEIYLYSNVRNYAKAEQYLLEGLKVYAKCYGLNSPAYSSNERELGILYYFQGKFDLAEKIFERLNERAIDLWGDLGSNRIDILKKMAELYAVGQNFDKANRFQLLAAEKELLSVLRDFVNLSEAEKNKYLSRIDINRKVNSLIFNNPMASADLKRSGFDYQLLFKSFILADTRNIIESIERGNDTILRQTYHKWKEGKAFLAKQYSLPELKRANNLNKIIEETEFAEKELNRNSSSFRKQQQALQIKTQDVEASLKNNEAAIEFVKFDLFNKKWKDTGFVYSDSFIYAAYVLRKGISSPDFIPLFEEKQLQKLFDSAGTSSDVMVSKFYRGLDLGNAGTSASLGKDLYNLVWAPLEPYLKGIKKISYSPAGKLYSIAFHALPVDSTTMLMDKYELNQYTSTRQVALRKTQETKDNIQSVTLFGNASFTLDSATIAKAKTGNQSVSNIYVPQNRGSRGGTWSDLPGTAEEVKKVKQLFEQNRIPTKSFTQTTATEENLKALSGNSPQVLHIATHGFFLPDPEKKRKDMGMNNENTYSLADDPLLRSGLILAGGNYAWSGKTPVEGVEDGIATAYEISQLNLSNTELVVLSACETALGDVKGSEGVFGLQRAFKMAGVKKMIVSLWQVPDKETAELMTSFYNYWLKGKTIEQSFTQAQADMRKKYSPYYWAAFVLVE